MELRPADLGARRCVAVVQDRAYSMHTGRGRLAGTSGGGEPGRIGLLGRLWLRGTGLDDKTGAAILQGTRGVTGGMVGGFAGGFGGGFGGPAIGMIMGNLFGHGDRPPLFLGVLFALMGLSGVGAGLLAPGVMVRRWLNAPLSEGEVEELIGASTEDLDRAYLTLVRDAVRQREVPDSVAAEVRAAIQQLGAALDSLPPRAAETALDAAALQKEAESVRAQGLAESDPVVAESLLRRADALARSAKAVGHAGQQIRRALAVRQELAAQVDALRLGLTAYYAGGDDAVHLSHLAEAARGVAHEATSLAAARAELDGYPQASGQADSSAQRAGLSR